MPPHTLLASSNRSRSAGAALVLALLAACASPPAAPPPEPTPQPAEEPAAEGWTIPLEDPVEPAAAVPDVEPEPEPPPPAPWPERVLAGMSLRQKAGQLLMPYVLGDYAPEGSPGHERIAAMVRDQGIGGVIVSVGSPIDVAVKLNDLQDHAAVPLLVAADLETGAGFRLRGAVHVPSQIELGGATDFPSLMALGAVGEPRLAYEMGRVTALEARAVGIHVPFAPVLDVNSNPKNPIINVRSFGEDPQRVAALGAAFVRGVEEHGGLATGKHFPGHGDTETDSHLALPVIRAPWSRLDTLELVPFRRAIQEGMGGIMTAHISVPALNGGNGLPSTLSPDVLTGLLRGRMGFQGLIFTDAMDMGAIDRRYGRGEAAVRALQAGADVILMPPSVEAALQGIVDAVADGRLSEARVDESALRILRVKARMGLDEGRTVPVDRVPHTVGIPSHEAVAREIAERSMTLLRNGRDVLPLRGTRSASVLSVTYRPPRDLLAGKYFDGRLRTVYPRLVSVPVEQNTPAPVWEGLLRQARSSQLVVVSLYVTAVSYSGSVAVPPEAVRFVRDLERAGVPHVVVSFGSPYLLGEFPDIQAYLLAWSGSEASQRAAARALFGEIPVTGRTPTRFPPHFDIGDGIHLPARGRADAP